jgi:phosphatidylinositol alpha-mannosyltransferase
MRIALVSPYDYHVPGGVGKHIAALSRQFRRAGHEVRIIAPSSGDEDQDGEDQQGIYRIGRVTPVPANGSVARITLSIPFGSRLSRRVRQVLAAEQFDVIHVHEPLMPTLPLAVLMANAGGAIKVGTFHAYRESYYGYYYGRPILRSMVNRLHGRVAVSRAAYEFVSRYFPGVYTLIPNGVDLEVFRHDVEPLAQYRDGRPTVLFVGRMEKRKGLAYLIRAYSEIRAQIPDVRVLVVGRQGRAGRGYQRYVQEHDLPGIEFVGEVSAAELPRYYQSCDVFCSPAVSGESFGMVLLEAMALGKPVVATAIDGYRQVVQDGVQGRLVAPRDSAGLAAALLELLGSPALRERYGEQGRLTAGAYSWQRVSARLLRFYDEVRQGSTSPGWRSPLEIPGAWLGGGDDLPVALQDGAPSLQVTHRPARRAWQLGGGFSARGGAIELG